MVKVQESKVLSAAPDQAGKARLIEAAAPHSGALLHARLCSAVGTRLDRLSLRIAVALQLGTPHICVCVADVDYGPFKSLEKFENFYLELLKVE